LGCIYKLLSGLSRFEPLDAFVCVVVAGLLIKTTHWSQLQHPPRRRRRGETNGGVKASTLELLILFGFLCYLVEVSKRVTFFAVEVRILMFVLNERRMDFLRKFL